MRRESQNDRRDYLEQGGSFRISRLDSWPDKNKVAVIELQSA